MKTLVFVAMTIGQVVHHLAIIHTTFMVDLPEDDTTTFRGTDAIAGRSMEHLLLSEETGIDYGFAELVMGR